MKQLLFVAMIAAVALPAQARDENERGVGGAFWGSIIGGYLGSNIGQGRGRTAATIGGAMVGAGVGDRMQNGDRDERRGYGHQYQPQVQPQYMPPPAVHHEYRGGYGGYRDGYYEPRQPTLRTNGDSVSLD